MKRTAIATLAVLALLAAGVAEAQTRNPSPAQKTATREGTGLVTYDPGAPADAFSGQQGPSVTVGNRFSSRNGSPLSTGSASFLSFYITNNTIGGGLLVFWGPPTGGGGAPAIASFTASPLSNGAFNGVSFTPLFVGSDFLAGIYLNSGQPGRGQIGMRSATTGGQGFHAMQISFGGGAGANYASIAGQNAMFRVAGTFVIPVELLEFELD